MRDSSGSPLLKPGQALISVFGMWRNRFRSLGWRFLPAVMANRARSFQIGVRHRFGITDLAQRLAERHGAAVAAGPFAGLQYPRERLPEVDAPVAKLVGSYEEELQPVIQSVLEQSGPSIFVNVGCADGYYAVGFALSSPEIVVFAYDIARSARQLCGELAELNEVQDRVHVRGRFVARDLAALDLRRALVMFDVEGAERELVPSARRWLVGAQVIVEIHEFAAPGALSAVKEAVASTHEVHLIRPTPRDPSCYPDLRELGVRDQALSEFRPEEGNFWVHLVPRVRRL